MVVASALESETAFTQLCHHLSLDRTGKVQGAVDNLVLAVFAIDPGIGDGDANEVATALSTYFGIELPVGEVRKALETHLRGGRLLHARPDGRIALSAKTRADIESRIAAADELESTVKREWLLEVAATHPALDGEKLWRALQAYLGAVFRKNGAMAVELLRSRPISVPDSSNGLVAMLNAALKSQSLKCTSESTAAVTMFFRSGTPARSRYVSQLLDGTFTFFALSVSDATAEFLREQLPSTRLFLDTNVVLGMLGLNENPLQEATAELLGFIRKHRLPYNLYCHERTLKELKELMSSAAARLLSVRYTPELSRAIVQWSQRSTTLTGIERRFHALNAEQPLDPKVFISKFDHVEELLAEQGVRLYRESGPDLDVTAKGSYIADFEHFLRQKRPGKPPRPYAALDHDVVLWMSLQRQRQRASNALKSGALLLTNDYALYDFDSRVLRGHDRSHVGTAVLPQQLIQVLRPLVGTTTDFDSHFLEVFAASEFRTAQSDYEETASLVVSYLATYEDVSTETAIRVLSDEVLLSRLKPDEQTESEFRELIENAVFQDNTVLLAEVEQERERAARANAERGAQVEAAATAAAKAEEAQQEAARLRVERDAARSRAAADERAAIERAAELKRGFEEEHRARLTAERELAAQVAVSGRRSLIFRIGLAGALALLGVLAIAIGPSILHWSTFTRHESRLSISLLTGTAWVAACWLIVRPRHWSAVASTLIVAAVLGIFQLL